MHVRYPNGAQREKKPMIRGILASNPIPPAAAAAVKTALIRKRSILLFSGCIRRERIDSMVLVVVVGVRKVSRGELADAGHAALPRIEEDKRLVAPRYPH